MSKEIEINKNYDEFGKSFITSRKPYQLVAIAGAFVIGVVVMFVFKPFMGTTIASYLALVVVIPLGVIGVYEKHGMDFITLIKKVQVLSHMEDLLITVKQKKRFNKYTSVMYNCCVMCYYNSHTKLGLSFKRCCYCVL